jgi:nitrite reductase/ring-hydroxylating ferredoxin subunit
MGQLIKVAEANDVPPGTAKAIEADGHRIALFHSGGSYYAIDDVCTHRGGALSEGEVDGTVVTCPLHGATFDITTGSVLGRPASEGVVSYRVQVDGNDIKVELP